MSLKLADPSNCLFQLAPLRAIELVISYLGPPTPARHLLGQLGYCDQHVREPGRRGVAPWAVDRAAAGRLWEVSRERTGLDVP
jgi:hypothetical protein